MTRIKLCGLTRECDVDLALELGADALGLVFEPSSPRYVGGRDDLLRWVRRLGPFGPPRVAVFGAIGERIDGFELVQARAFRRGALHRLRVLRPEPDLDVTVLDASGVHAILLDAYHPTFDGGTGRRVNLTWASALRDRLESEGVPMVLAGGLTPENVGEAIRVVRPYAVDVGSGIESAPGQKDPARMRAFVQAVRASG